MKSHLLFNKNQFLNANAKRYAKNFYQCSEVSQLNTIDPILSTPEIFRDEFNAYKRTTLQELLYNQLFREREVVSTASTIASFLDIPSLSFEDEELVEAEIDMSEFELHMNELIEQVVWWINLVQRGE